MKIAQNEAQLKALLHIMANGDPWTAGMIAAAMGCSKPSAYKRLKALSERGYRFEVTRLYGGAPGPAPMGYSLVSSRKRR